MGICPTELCVGLPRVELKCSVVENEGQLFQRKLEGTGHVLSNQVCWVTFDALFTFCFYRRPHFGWDEDKAFLLAIQNLLVLFARSKCETQCLDRLPSWITALNFQKVSLKYNQRTYTFFPISCSKALSWHFRSGILAWTQLCLLN